MITEATETVWNTDVLAGGAPAYYLDYTYGTAGMNSQSETIDYAAWALGLITELGGTPFQQVQ